MVELVVGDLVHFIQILPPVRMVLLILAAVVVQAPPEEMQHPLDHQMLEEQVEMVYLHP